VPASSQHHSQTEKQQLVSKSRQFFKSLRNATMQTFAFHLSSFVHIHTKPPTFRCPRQTAICLPYNRAQIPSHHVHMTELRILATASPTSVPLTT